MNHTGRDPNNVLRNPERLAALRRVALLDTPTEQAFDRLTRLASKILRAPMALVALVNADRQFFKSSIGLPEPWASRRETPLSHSFCQYEVASGEPLIIADARVHPLVCDNRAIPDLGVVAYAGIPLITPDGYALGSFCVIDTQPRTWAVDEIGILKDLAAAVMTEIELRAATRAVQREKDELERRVQERTAALSDANERLHRELVERQRAEAALRASEERFRILFEHSPDAILLVDPHHPGGQWSIVDCNEVACRMNGYTREELIGQSLHLLNVHTPDADEDSAHLEQLRRTGVLQGEAVHRRKDGTLVPIEYSTSLITLAGCELVLGIDRDITARKQAEGALQTARSEAERLEELDRLRDDFIATVSHDLRTPLTAARAALILLQTTAIEPHRADERALVDNARRNIERLNLLIEDLLTLNRFEAGTLRLDVEPLDLRAVVTDAMAAVHPLIREKGQLLEVDLMEPLPTKGDLRRLEQVLVNLLANAHHHTPTGTRITISGRIMDSEVVLSVRDTGPGIPPEELERIFQRFHRLTSAEGGSGLGLAIARSLVHLHHGRIWAESRLGAGATVCVALPHYANGAQP